MDSKGVYLTVPEVCNLHTKAIFSDCGLSYLPHKTNDDLNILGIPMLEFLSCLHCIVVLLSYYTFE